MSLDKWRRTGRYLFWLGHAVALTRFMITPTRVQAMLNHFNVIACLEAVGSRMLDSEDPSMVSCDSGSTAAWS